MLSFANRNEAAAVRRRHAYAFTGGVILSLAALGGLLLVLRALGQSVGWGFQLQSPVFVAAMALLFVLIVPEQATEQHLQILSELAELFSEGACRDALKAADSAQAVCRIFAREGHPHCIAP